MKTVSTVGDWPGQLAVLVLVLVAGLALYRKDLIVVVRYGLLSFLFAGALAHTMKHLIGRPRPWRVAEGFESLGPSFKVGFDSFPSGHTATGFAAFIILAIFIPRLRYPLYAAVIIIAFSRIFLGAHFPSDVLGGTIIGTVSAAFFSLRCQKKFNLHGFEKR